MSTPSFCLLVIVVWPYDIHRYNIKFLITDLQLSRMFMANMKLVEDFQSYENLKQM